MSGRMGIGCWILISQNYKNTRWALRDHKHLRNFITTAYVIYVSEGADYNTMFGTLFLSHSESVHSTVHNNFTIDDQ